MFESHQGNELSKLFDIIHKLALQAIPTADSVDSWASEKENTSVVPVAAATTSQ